MPDQQEAMMDDDPQNMPQPRRFVNNGPDCTLAFSGLGASMTNVWDDLKRAATAHPGNIEALAQALRELATPPGLNTSCIGNVYLMTGQCHSIGAIKVYHPDGTIEYREPDE